MKDRVTRLCSMDGDAAKAINKLIVRLSIEFIEKNKYKDCRIVKKM